MVSGSSGVREAGKTNEQTSRAAKTNSGQGETAFLALEDGRCIKGLGFGAQGVARGELVFTTNMTGYQESCTDPSFAGQVLMFTFPLIGNYGVVPGAAESERIWPEAVVVKQWCQRPNHRNLVGTIHDLLLDQGRPGISGVDTRDLTISIRERGTLRCVVGVGPDQEPEELVEMATGMDWPSDKNLAAKVSCDGSLYYPFQGPGGKATLDIRGCSQPGLTPQTWKSEYSAQKRRRPLVALIDTGVKANILREWQLRANIVRLPWNTSYEKVQAVSPDLLFVSNGPGDPDHPALEPLHDLLRKAGENGLPIAGICLGHQMLGLAFGGRTGKLKFGHRGGNQPVKDLRSGRCYITSQNHGYAVTEVPEGMEATLVNLNDSTNEGLAHTELNITSTQFHPEAHPGPLDTKSLFDEFLKMANGADKNG